MNTFAGAETFHDRGQPLSFSVVDFWRWSSSDLLGNAIRGVLAEFLVARALDSADAPRVEWNACDLCTATGLRIEVKTSGYLQTWAQTKPSRPSFSIGPKRSWHAESNTYETVASRGADVYVFALHAHADRSSADPTDVSQWQFFVVPTAVLNERCGEQKQVSLARVRELSNGPVAYAKLREAIQRIEAARAKAVSVNKVYSSSCGRIT